MTESQTDLKKESQKEKAEDSMKEAAHQDLMKGLQQDSAKDRQGILTEGQEVLSLNSTRLSATNAEKNAKFLSNQQAASQFTAATASRKETILIQEEVEAALQMSLQL